MLEVGDKVKWRYYNTPEQKFYGPVREGEIALINWENKIGNTKRPFLVHRNDGGQDVWLSRKEILGKV